MLLINMRDGWKPSDGSARCHVVSRCCSGPVITSVALPASLLMIVGRRCWSLRGLNVVAKSPKPLLRHAECHNASQLRGPWCRSAEQRCHLQPNWWLAAWGVSSEDVVNCLRVSCRKVENVSSKKEGERKGEKTQCTTVQWKSFVFLNIKIYIWNMNVILT